ncbi:hypothetical protein FRC01_008955 [Tulasnella sp. 417]|nr:hypothetical protein FRC01_008955 [Tulasnella sp. 417]
MAPLAEEINAAGSNADLEARGNDGIAITEYKVKRWNPTVIKVKWSHHRRSPEKFTIWLRNVKTQDYYKARDTVWTSSGYVKFGLDSLDYKEGKYQVVLTKWRRYKKVYARSGTFHIGSSDFY